jgi:hypothetical protein
MLRRKGRPRTHWQHWTEGRGGSYPLLMPEPRPQSPALLCLDDFSCHSTEVGESAVHVVDKRFQGADPQAALPRDNLLETVQKSKCLPHCPFLWDQGICSLFHKMMLKPVGITGGQLPVLVSLDPSHLPLIGNQQDFLVRSG